VLNTRWQSQHTNRLLHRKCAVRIFIHEAQHSINERVSVANKWVSKVLQQVNKICTKHFLWCNLFVIYMRPISCNKPSKYVFFIFHTVKYKIIFHRFIAWKWSYIYNKHILLHDSFRLKGKHVIQFNLISLIILTVNDLGLAIISVVKIMTIVTIISQRGTQQLLLCILFPRILRL